MTVLSTAARKKLKKSQFAGPGRSYPIEDKAHARNALARASAQRNAGRMPESEYETITSRARKKLK